METLRTPDDRFADLSGWPYEPKYADIPDQDSLRASLVGLLQGPARGIASMLSAVPGSVARVLDAHAASGAEGDAEA